MARFSFSRRIERPCPEVFRLFTDFDGMAQRIDSITEVEMLTSGPPGVGTRFRETRELFGKRATEELEVTDFTPEEGYVVEAQSHGTHYRSVFQFEPVGDVTDVSVSFEARPVSVAARLLAPLGWLMMGTTRRIFARDVEALKQSAEGNGRG